MIGFGYYKFFSYLKYEKMLLHFMEVSPARPPLPVNFASILTMSEISFESDVDISSYQDVGFNLDLEEMLLTQMQGKCFQIGCRGNAFAFGVEKMLPT